MAPTGPLSHDVVLANHQAIGVPIISSTMVTVVARRSVSQIAAISVSEKIMPDHC